MCRKVFRVEGKKENKTEKGDATVRLAQEDISCKVQAREEVAAACDHQLLRFVQGFMPVRESRRQ